MTVLLIISWDEYFMLQRDTYDQLSCQSNQKRCWGDLGDSIRSNHLNHRRLWHHRLIRLTAWNNSGLTRSSFKRDLTLKYNSFFLNPWQWSQNWTDQWWQVNTQDHMDRCTVKVRPRDRVGQGHTKAKIQACKITVFGASKSSSGSKGSPRMRILGVKLKIALQMTNLGDFSNTSKEINRVPSVKKARLT